MLWDGGHGTAVTLLWHCCGTAELAQGVWLFPVFGHTKQGLALLSFKLWNKTSCFSCFASLFISASSLY